MSTHKKSSGLLVGDRPWPPSDSDLKRAVKFCHVSEPTQDPSEVYPEVEGLPDTYDLFRLGSLAMPEDKRQRALMQAREYHTHQKHHLLGFQCNQALHYSKAFSSYLDTHVNNIGDPYTTGNFTINSKFMERSVLDYYAALWNARWPHDKNDLDSYWGFSLTMGSTEGNLYGMWNARDYLSGKKLLIDDGTGNNGTTRSQKRRRTVDKPAVHPRLVYVQAPPPEESPNAYTPIAFYSEDTHYSLAKAVTMLAIRTFSEVGRELFLEDCPLEDWTGNGWPDEVPSHDNGSIDIEALATLVEFFAAKGYPILVCFNYGTTFKGAYDDVEAAGYRLLPILVKYGLDERKVYYDDSNLQQFDVRTGYWFHVDGALGAAYMPYIEMAHKAKIIKERGPNFDFRLPFVHSIAMSGHKWLGIPNPCGIYMTRTKNQMLPPDNPDYIGTPDTTFAGSRNGLSAMLLWDYHARHSYSDLVEKALRLEALAKYAEELLLELQKQLGKDLWVARTPLALTVRFRQANAELVTKYTLASETLNGRKYSHIFMMEHVTKALLDEFVEELSHEGAFIDDSAATPAVTTLKAKDRAPLTTYHRALVPHAGRGYHA